MKEEDLSRIKRYSIVEYLERKGIKQCTGHLPMLSTVHHFVKTRIQVSR